MSRITIRLEFGHREASRSGEGHTVTTRNECVVDDAPLCEMIEIRDERRRATASIPPKKHERRDPIRTRECLPYRLGAFDVVDFSRIVDIALLEVHPRRLYLFEVDVELRGGYWGLAEGFQDMIHCMDGFGSEKSLVVAGNLHLFVRGADSGDLFFEILVDDRMLLTTDDVRAWRYRPGERACDLDSPPIDLDDVDTDVVLTRYPTGSPCVSTIRDGRFRNRVRRSDPKNYSA